MKSWVKTTLKIVFAASIMAWLFKSGKLDFSLVPQTVKNLHLWPVVVALLIMQDIVAAFRWRMILGINSNKKLRPLDMIRVTWIGLFFNNFLPGAVTGDLIKLVYIRDLDRDLSKTYLVMSVFIDRMFGLVGLLCILGISNLFYYREMISLGPQMELFVHFNLFLFLGGVLFMIGLFLPERWQERILRQVQRIPLLGNRFAKTFKQFWIIGKSKKVVMGAILISLFIQFISCFAFYYLSRPFYETDLPLSYILSLIPIGFIAVAVPISPAGIGLGHVVFDQLFELIGISGGANYFNLYFLYLISVNSLGFFPYILGGKRPNLASTQEFEREAL